MTRTVRYYNKRPIVGGPGFKGWMSSKRMKNCDLHPKVQYEWETTCSPWVGYDPYRQLRIRICKDPMIGKRRRLAYKQRLRQDVLEYAAPDLDDWETDYVMRGIKDLPEWGKCPHSYDW